MNCDSFEELTLEVPGCYRFENPGWASKDEQKPTRCRGRTRVKFPIVASNSYSKKHKYKHNKAIGQTNVRCGSKLHKVLALHFLNTQRLCLQLSVKYYSNDRRISNSVPSSMT